MKAFTFVALIVLVGCGQPEETPNFVTDCGLEFYGFMPNAEFAADMNLLESITISEFDKLKDEKLAGTCSRLAGVKVYQLEEELLHAENPDEASFGETDCNAIWLANLPNEYSSLPHELAHFSERCFDSDHATWSERGVYRADWRARVIYSGKKGIPAPIN